MTILTTSVEAPGEAAVRELVYTWYRLLDAHAPVEEYFSLLSDHVELVMPEATLNGMEGFIAWYRGGSEKYALPGVVNVFFDEEHELKRIDISIDEGAAGANRQASVLVVVRWVAHRWAPPKARSELLRFDSWLRWVVEFSSQGHPMMRQYVVEKLEPLQGSARL